MDELKSAWEIAQERVSRLGKLSADEQRQQQRQRCHQVGLVLAGKWLDGSEKMDLALEIGQHGEDDRPMVRDSVIQQLVQAIEPASAGSIERVTKGIEGINTLAPELGPGLDEIRRLLHEYEEAEREARQEVEGSYRETLHRLRISGTAVAGINIEATEEWQAARQRLVEAFSPRFEDLKRALR
ncbi:MAG: hypothetical protein ACNA7X_04450 [Dehalococcoidia bacterium]